MGRVKDKLENLVIITSKINYGIRNRKTKMLADINVVTSLGKF